MPTRVEDILTGGYRASDQTHDFSYDRGLIQLPVASRVAGSRLIRLHGGCGKRVVRFRFVREGKPPIIPAMADTSGDTLLAASVAPATPMPSVTGRGLDWVVSGEYVYAQDTPRIVGNHALPVGQHPFLDRSLVSETQAAVPSSAINLYVNTVSEDPATAFQLLVETTAAATTINADGDYSWPLFALPTAFSSNHIIQD